MEKKEFYSLPELATLMGISRVAVFKKVQAGLIRAKKIGKSYAVSEIDAQEFIVKEEAAQYGDMAIFREDNGAIEINARLYNDTVWFELKSAGRAF